MRKGRIPERLIFEKAWGKTVQSRNYERDSYVIQNTATSMHS